MTLPKIHNFYNELHYRRHHMKQKPHYLCLIVLPVKFQPFLSRGLAATTFCCFIFRSQGCSCRNFWSVCKLSEVHKYQGEKMPVFTLVINTTIGTFQHQEDKSFLRLHVNNRFVGHHKSSRNRIDQYDALQIFGFDAKRYTDLHRSGWTHNVACGGHLSDSNVYYQVRL